MDPSQVMPHLRVGGVVILDDCQRPGEVRIARNWDLIYPGQFHTRVLAVDHHLCVKHRVSQRQGRPSLRVLGDNYLRLWSRWRST